MKLEKGREGVNMGREKLPRFQTLQRSYEKAVQLLPPRIEKETETRDMPYVAHQAHIFFCFRPESLWASSSWCRVQWGIAPERADTETWVTLDI